jgi:hypothetical protein
MTTEAARTAGAFAALAAATLEYHERMLLDLERVEWAEVLDEYDLSLEALEVAGGFASFEGTADPSAMIRAFARKVTAQRREFAEWQCGVAEELNRLRGVQNQAEHDRHGAWRGWRVTRRVLRWAYLVGLLAGYGQGWSSACSGCVNVIRFRGKSPYVLGVRREWWFCLLRGRHLRREIDDAPYLCAVCAPCPECGSPDPAHEIDVDCERETSRPAVAGGAR